jgi:hypothetical protein
MMYLLVGQGPRVVFCNIFKEDFLLLFIYLFLKRKKLGEDKSHPSRISYLSRLEEAGAKLQKEQPK